MSIWRKLLSLVGLRPVSAPRKYGLSESMQVTLTTLSQHDGRPEEELIQDLLAADKKFGVNGLFIWNIFYNFFDGQCR